MGAYQTSGVTQRLLLKFESSLFAQIAMAAIANSVPKTLHTHDKRCVKFLETWKGKSRFSFGVSPLYIPKIPAYFIN